MTRRRPRPVGDRGQASVELALLLPVVLLLLLAVLQVGLLARDVVLVTHAAREAARAAATDPSPDAARAAALASSGLDPARVAVTMEVVSGESRRVQVVVAYRAPTAVPLVGTLLADRTIRTTATMRLETPPSTSTPRHPRVLARTDAAGTSRARARSWAPGSGPDRCSQALTRPGQNRWGSGATGRGWRAGG